MDQEEIFKEITTEDFLIKDDLLPGCIFSIGWKYARNEMLSLAYKKATSEGVIRECLLILEIKNCRFTEQIFINDTTLTPPETIVPCSAEQRELWEPILEKFRTIFKDS